jgi:tRNA pseudouridine32 synthase / 23S rRNA pseudouridine746 synthase
MARSNGTTRVAFEPLTGRTHQLRTHAAHPLGLGCPIAGDALYGDPLTSPRLLLHARTLSFAHPTSGARLTFDSAVPF